MICGPNGDSGMESGEKVKVGMEMSFSPPFEGGAGAVNCLGIWSAAFKTPRVTSLGSGSIDAYYPPCPPFERGGENRALDFFSTLGIVGQRPPANGGHSR
jgi:hypothetical protein